MSFAISRYWPSLPEANHWPVIPGPSQSPVSLTRVISLQVSSGDPWSPRTTVFLCQWPSSTPTKQIVIKEDYQQALRRYDEPEVLLAIHSQGFVPGVARTVDAETVTEQNNEPITPGEGYDLRGRGRLAIADVGQDLWQAKSVGTTH